MDRDPRRRKEPFVGQVERSSTEVGDAQPDVRRYRLTLREGLPGGQTVATILVWRPAAGGEWTTLARPVALSNLVEGLYLDVDFSSGFPLPPER